MLQLVAAGHAAAVFAQSVSAGLLLEGNYDMLANHHAGADVVTYLGLSQLAVALLVWARGGPRWPSAASALLLAGESGQYFAGLAGALDLHVPLGVALAAGSVLMLVALLRPRTVGVPR
jgi:hypothetical protein